MPGLRKQTEITAWNKGPSFVFLMTDDRIEWEYFNLSSFFEIHVIFQMFILIMQVFVNLEWNYKLTNSAGNGISPIPLTAFIFFSIILVYTVTPSLLLSSFQSDISISSIISNILPLALRIYSRWALFSSLLINSSNGISFSSSWTSSSFWFSTPFYSSWFEITVLLLNDLNISNCSWFDSYATIDSVSAVVPNSLLSSWPF